MIKLLDLANSLDKQETNEGFKEKALALAAAAGMAYGGYNKYIATDRPPRPDTIQTAPQEQFSFEDQYRISAESILDNIEGAYVNPSKLKGEKEKKIFSSSGETMYGIDRLTGGKKNKTSKGREFWRLIDQDKKINPEKWVRYYSGGNLENKLKDLAINIMESEFKRLFNNTLSPESQEIVKSDPRLFFHFVYATWNGSGHFNDFAKSFNRRVREGEIDPDYLFDTVINDRLDKGGVIRQKADKVRQAAESLFF